MKINRAFSEYNQEQLKVNQQNQASNAKKAAVAEAKPTTSDALDFSATAKQIDQSKQKEGIDTQKVAALKAAINNGTYQVDAQAIAGKMMSEIQTQKGN